MRENENETTKKAAKSSKEAAKSRRVSTSAGRCSETEDDEVLELTAEIRRAQDEQVNVLRRHDAIRGEVFALERRLGQGVHVESSANSGTASPVREPIFDARVAKRVLGIADRTADLTSGDAEVLSLAA